jgi:hypothetical protein
MNDPHPPPAVAEAIARLRREAEDYGCEPVYGSEAAKLFAADILTVCYAAEQAKAALAGLRRDYDLNNCRANAAEQRVKDLELRLANYATDTDLEYQLATAITQGSQQLNRANELERQLSTVKATALREAAIRSLESASMPMSATHWLHAEADRISKEGKL